MKIAINRCFGGFGLSDKAIEMIMKRKGFECYRYIQTKYSFEDGVDEYKRITENDVNVSTDFIDYSKVDLGEYTEKIPDEYYWYYGTDLERNDEDLISVIEELGEDANGFYGNIHIVEIPDGVDWEINDYDGMETVEEKHRSWC